MRIEERMLLVDHYFATISDDQFERDMREAGMGELISWRELGIQLHDDKSEKKQYYD